MPTGYTASLHDGAQSFEDFAWGVARGFGAFITMRDEPLDTPVPDQFHPTSYHLDKIAEAKATIAMFTKMTEDALADAEEGEREAAHIRREHYIREREARRRRYEAMLEQARAYEPPTPDHENFKATMVEQLERSIDFDCGDVSPSVPDPLIPAEYRAEKLAKAHHDVDYHEREHAKEVERAEKRTAWVQALRESLASREEEQK